jgi:hypothetical protein
VLLRWLLPVVAVFALLGNAVAAFAAAGTFGESKCCCPSPKVCKCHDHDKPRPDEQMRRCSGDAVKVTPHLQVVTMPETFETVLEMAEHVIEYDTIVISDQYVTHPEKPPF